MSLGPPKSHYMRRALAPCLAALVLAGAVTACGSDNNSSTSTSSGGGAASTTTSKKKASLAMITASSTQNAFNEMAYGAQVAATDKGVNLKEAAPNGVNGPKEVQLFQAAMQTSRDGIAAMTTTPDLFVRPFSQAVAQNIPVVAVDAGPLPGANVKTFVGNSNTEVGQKLATEMLKKIPANATGEVVIGNPIPGLPLLSLRINGMKQVLKKERPNLKILGPFNVGTEPTDNYNHWNNLVKAHPNAVAYLEPGDQGAVSFGRIEKQTGKKYLVGACDVDPGALDAVKAGYVYALGDPEHFLKGYVAIALLADNANGKKLPEGWFNPGAGIVTAANVDDIIAREKSNAARKAFYKDTLDKELANPTAYIKPLDQAN
jgi:ABC-type sugar transport system substrate-binding protein